VGPGKYDLGPGGPVEITGPPGLFPLATLIGVEHVIKIGATEPPVVAASPEYVGLFERMLAAFKAAYP
jgi:hypothetical protein